METGGGARMPATALAGAMGPLELLLLTVLAASAALAALALRADAHAPGNPLLLITSRALEGARGLGPGGSLALVGGAIAFAAALFARDAHRALGQRARNAWAYACAAPRL
jgi:hypothetical protein